MRIAEGDEQAFRQLVGIYSNKVFFHALSFAKTWQQAEEITQDIFLRIWQKRDKLLQVTNLESFIFVVSKNILISFIRKKVHRFEPPEADLQTALIQSSSALYEGKELGLLLEKAIDHLPDQKRQVFRMIHQEGLSQDDVAQKLGIATRTVRWNLVSAINGIKDFLHRYSVDELYLFFILAPALL